MKWRMRMAAMTLTTMTTDESQAHGMPRPPSCEAVWPRCGRRISKVEECRDSTAYETRRRSTDGAVSSWVMLIRDDRGAASSLSASMMLMFRESEESFASD